MTSVAPRILSESTYRYLVSTHSSEKRKHRRKKVPAKKNVVRMWSDKKKDDEEDDMGGLDSQPGDETEDRREYLKTFFLSRPFCYP